MSRKSFFGWSLLIGSFAASCGKAPGHAAAPPPSATVVQAADRTVVTLTEEAHERLGDREPHAVTSPAKGRSSSSSGIASAQASREATIDPDAFAIRNAASSSSPETIP